ncbi:heavy metal translocating P-type ATPase [uncultured Dysosmobacter sp.]|uniref:heavy metal translocating P-type ATPase n=1 Tax=uncultured Dysosmobacter sp. TaxID=2591384 RepID=UPI0026716B74|nr:heavy metal translocating P-type ATPase [uncultured Dysosmobacter sp.]
MKCTILHDTAGRLRVHLCCKRMTLRQADVLEYYLLAVDGVRSVKVYDRTRDAVVVYDAERERMIRALARFSFEKAEKLDLAPEHTSRTLNREFEDKLALTVMRRCASNLFLPAPVTSALAVIRSAKYIKEGLLALWHRKLSVAVLDATAVTVSMVRGDFATAGSVMFMLRLGEILEEWTHKKSVADLASAMSLRVENVWQQVDGTEVLTKVTDVKPGDRIVIRTGGMIPLDGRVVEGEAMVNQSSLTGESMPVAKRPGSPVYAGTVAEEGECVVCVEKVSGSGRYDRVVRMIEESEKLKSTAEDKASRMADRLVPYTLGGTAVTYLLTRDVTKMLAVLMVDFSCALKLAIPVAVLSAMRESSGHHISVKGGRFLEAVAKADTIVFDKTGTLTYATPKVAQIVPFGGHREADMLRLAACLEEHYPHSMANAVVEEAKRRGLTHEEYHSQVQYVVAHGISSMVENKKVIIGSAHFVFEDEGCCIPEGEQEKYDALPAAYSHLYLCIDGELAAVICIHDPLRREAKDAVKALHESGFTNVVMMTGDNRRTAESVAAEVGVDAVYAEVLPEDKAAFIRQEKEKGHTVIMVGDGVNDSPALSEADAGIAISTGAAIAREIADITVASEDLFELVTLRKLSEALMDRIHGSYRFIVAFNLSLITLGVAGVLPPAISALLHNTSTLGIGLKNMTDLLEEHEGA